MTTGRGVVSGVSVAHQRADVETLERAGADSQRAGVERLLSNPDVEEAVVLQTCNRVEAYVVVPAEAGDAGRRALETVTDGVPDDAVRHLNHERSLRHLLRVAAGLESVVLGEDQILGQVRTAYEDAVAAGGIGPVLEEAVTKAIRVGERARTETAINDGTLSLASAAVRLAARRTDLSGETGLAVGAGEMGHLAARSLADRVDRVVVANRTVPHAEHVVENVDAPAEAVGLDGLEDAVADAGVVITATGSPDTILDRETLAAAGETVVVDIAQPRDVAEPPADAPVTVADLDDLEAVTAETRASREAAARVVEDIVDAEFDRLITQFKRKRADEVISAMYESAERVKAAETRKALAAADFDDDQAEVLEAMADAIVSQLLAAPTESLRDAAEDDDWETIQTALTLFDPEFGEDAAPAAVSEMVADVEAEELSFEVGDAPEGVPGGPNDD